MKTKIIAAVLAAVLLLHVGGEFTRAKATGAAVAGIAAIGILAFNLLGVMTGQYDDTAEGINCFIENGVEGWQNAFVGTEDTPSWFASGWQQIYNTCSSWFDSGEITINDDGKVRMKYSQYLDLCGLVGNASADFNIELSTDIPYLAFKASPDVGIIITDSVSVLPSDGGEMSYFPVFYDSNCMYIPNKFFYLNFYPYPGDEASTYYSSVFVYRYDPLKFSQSFYELHRYANGRNYGLASQYLDSLLFSITANASSMMTSNKRNDSYTTSLSWVKFDGSSLSSVDSIDPTDLSFAYLNCEGKPVDFIKSITSFKSTIVPADIDDLSDPLATVLTKTTDPTLEIDTDPAIASPDDAVMVTDIPGEGDLTLSQLKEKTRTDIDIPSLIADKFPFCIPFDFIRIISVLCADPVAPVFRIPISTNPENLEAFEGNQTIGDVPEDFKPMFDIDEEIVIDLSCIPLVQPICYTIFILGFVILLIYITPKMINH